MKKKAVLLVCCLAITSAHAAHHNQSESDYKKQWKNDLRKYSIPENSTELHYVSSFPSEELFETQDILLNDPRNLAIDNEHNIFVSDNKEHRVLKFNAAGEFLLKFGQRGQGPGELIQPNLLTVTEKNKIIVTEIGNMRFQYFNKTGSYIQSFKVYKDYASITTDKNGIILAAPLLQRNTKFLIDILSQEGEVLKSFGEPLNVNYDKTCYNKSMLDINDKEEIFLAFENLALTRKYSKDGELIREYRLNYPLFMANEDYNKRNQALLARGKRVKYKPVINDIYVHKNGFFIFHNYPRIEILDYGPNGELNRVYWKDYQSFPYIAFNFTAIKRGDQYRFYILQIFPSPRIDIFEVNEEVL